MKPKKSLYGFGQSPSNWLGTMDVELAVVGFVILMLYVHDTIFLSTSKTPLKMVKKS